ncbi:MAG: iron-containing alcohol dehydrogenase, partial [Cyanobacteria bacterium P01_D01_bin.2]
NALMISHVIRYNATDAPFKQAIFPQYEYPQAKARYGAIADTLNLGGDSDDDKVDRLIETIEALKRQLDIPTSLREVLEADEQTFFAHLDLMAEQAFDDQCTGANPRYPLIRDLKALYIDAYRGRSLMAAPAAPPDSEPAAKTLQEVT